MIRATYASQDNLERFLAGIFGEGRAEVSWVRGRFQCEIPRKLQRSELERLRSTIAMEDHY